jgi:uncharacterized protein (TIGR00661 family)
MKILFLVQGEGRGHLTQAIALAQILREAGHEIAGALVGISEGRQIPAFFQEQIQTNIYYFDGLNIIYKANGKGMDLTRTIATHLAHTPKYLRSLSVINKTVHATAPDLIINFYEIFGGLYNLMYRSGIPTIAVAHQYLLLHPQFTFPEKSFFNRFLINLNSWGTSLFINKRLALSFRQIETRNDLRVTVVPPLLRKEIQQLHTSDGDFFLVYMTHHSLSKQIIDWHTAHPEVKLHCFWDNPSVSQEFHFDETLTFHRINSEKYLRMLSSCKALVTTAGFESVCEAMYLGKPVMMVPVPNHFEQQCNAIDGVISGAGVASKTFDLSVLMHYLPAHRNTSEKFRTWYHEGKQLFLNEIAYFEKKKPVAARIQPTFSASDSLS